MKKFVGYFTLEQCKNGEDKVAVEAAKKKTGLKYVGSKIVKRNGARVLAVYVMSLDAYMNHPEI